MGSAVTRGRGDCAGPRVGAGRGRGDISGNRGNELDGLGALGALGGTVACGAEGRKESPSTPFGSGGCAWTTEMSARMKKTSRAMVDVALRLAMQSVNVGSMRRGRGVYIPTARRSPSTGQKTGRVWHVACVTCERVVVPR